MSVTTTNTSRTTLSKTGNSVRHGFARQQLTVSTVVKTMLEIISIKSGNTMDKETQRQFPMIAKEIILLAEQTQ